MSKANELLRELPSVDRLLNAPRGEALLQRFNREYVVRHCRRALDNVRSSVRRGGAPNAAIDVESILNQIEEDIAADSKSKLQRVVNATGTILHTNLGRAGLPQAAIDAISLAASHTINLEYDLTKGGRGRRETVIEDLLVDLTGAEAATVVNNNAAAVLLALNALAESKEVIVSRGELIEIGGSFRIPEIMSKSGAILREVGTTNRTHIADYERAIGERTALLLKVHTSNYRIVGFTSEVSLPDLVALAAKHKLPVMEDLGSGALLDLSQYGLPKEPQVAERITMGADIVTFSGDKLLGGPQAGLIVGKKEWIARIRDNPLHRALRCSKLTIVALEATLRLYEQSPNISADLPTLRALARPLTEIEELAHAVLPKLESALGRQYRVSIESSISEIGSGALPTSEIPTKVMAIAHDGISAEKIAERFRSARPPILGRIKDGRFLLDLRTIFEPEDVIPRWE
jgi:L-seryl-tRNA(Ser) seleniumtransferase